MAYPTDFTDKPVVLGKIGLDQLGADAVEKLSMQGFEVVVGIRQSDVQSMAEIAQQASVREYCPKDLAKRFGNIEMAKQWLETNGGRALYLLREKSTQTVRGYGWTREGTSEKVPDGTSTFAIRLDERVSGQGLGLQFVILIISGSMSLYGMRRLWGETWGSNVGAVKTYVRAGAVLVTTEDDWRPTLKPTPEEAEDGKRRDVRVFLTFPRTFV